MHENIKESVKIDAKAVGVDLVTFTELDECFGIAWDVPSQEICQVCPARTECFTVFPRTVGRVRKEIGEDASLDVLAKRLDVSTQAVLLALGGSVDGSIDAMLEVVPPTKPAKKKTRKRAGKKTGKKNPPPPKAEESLSDQPEVLGNEGGDPVCQACQGTGGSGDEPCSACTGVGHQEAGSTPPDAPALEPAPGPAPESGPQAPQAVADPESTQGVVEYPRIAAVQVGRLQVLLDRGFTLTEALTRVGFDVVDAGA